jgi:HlyD family secretion protein
MKRIISTLTLLLLVGCKQPVTEQVMLENVDIIVNASGELESKTTAIIAPPSVSRMWQYPIKQIIPENTQVKKGEFLIAFDDKKVRDRMTDKQASLHRAVKELENKKLKEIETEQELILGIAEKEMMHEKAQRKANILDNSRSDNDRKKSVIDFTIAKDDLFLAHKKLKFHQSNKQLNIKQMSSKVDRLTSEVNQLKHDITRLNVKSPIDGMVIYRSNWEGEKPAAGESVQFGQPVMEIAVIDKMQLKAQVAEPDSGKVATGQRVKITLDGTQEIVIEGKIESLGRVFRDKSFQDKRRIFDVIISLDSTDPRLRPGMTARVDIVTEILTDQLTLPANVVSFEGGQHHVAKVTILGTEKIDITVKTVNGNKVIISNGVAKGDEVAL